MRSAGWESVASSSASSPTHKNESLESASQQPSTETELNKQSKPDQLTHADSKVPLQATPQGDYLLLIDEASGELAAESKPLFAQLLLTLQAESSLFVALTGISVSEPGSLKGMRDALKQAELVSSLLVKEGISQDRIGIEGSSSRNPDQQPHSVMARLRK